MKSSSRRGGARERLAPLTASELGRYVFCARAWWMQRVLGVTPGNAEALQRGSARHEAHGGLVRRAGRQANLARWLFIVALALAAALLYSLLR